VGMKFRCNFASQFKPPKESVLLLSSLLSVVSKSGPAADNILCRNWMLEGLKAQGLESGCPTHLLLEESEAGNLSKGFGTVHGKH